LGSAAAELGIVGDEQRALLAAFDAGDCRTRRDILAAQIGRLVGAAGDRVVASIGDTAATHATDSSDTPGMPDAVADLHRQTVTALDRLARLQAAAARLKAEPNAGACSADCPCAQAVEALASSPVVPADDIGLVLAPASGLGPAIACTLEGGIEAMHDRVGEWQNVVGQAMDRRGVAGGVTLTYGHGERLAVEIARLAAAEYACCSFFTFSLTVGPAGMTFTVTAPEEARDVVTAVFGVYGPPVLEVAQ
jgi:hypothetical protein